MQHSTVVVQYQAREAMMEMKCVLLQVFALLTSTADSQDCPSGYKFTVQPPTELNNCNPVRIYLSLQCATVSTADIVTWYWTQNICEAGINGTTILPGDTSDNYQVTSFGTNIRQIGFTGSESTLGYYWCEISNAVNVSLRPSTITPVLQPTNMSLPACTNALVISSHNDNPECAEEDSPTVHSHPLLPSSCVPPQLTLMDSTSTSIVTVAVPPTTCSPGSSTMIIVVIAVAVFIVLTALGLVLLLVIIWNFRRKRTTMSSTRLDTHQSTNDGEDDAVRVQNEMYSSVTQMQMESSNEDGYYYSTLTAC